MATREAKGTIELEPATHVASTDSYLVDQAH